MNKIFVKTTNVKNFIRLIENLNNKSKKIPKMGLVHRKIERYKHLYDRFSEILKFKTFRVNDLSQIIGQLSDVTLTHDTIKHIHSKFNRFKQILRLINQLEIIANAVLLEYIAKTYIKF